LNFSEILKGGIYMDLTAITKSVSDFLSSLPAILSALLTFLFGWLVAVALKFLVPKIFSSLRFDRLSEKAGLTGFLNKGNVKHSPSKLLGIFAYWIVMLFVLMDTVARLDRGAASSLSRWLQSALPSLLAAVITVVIGVMVVSFLANFTETIARNAAVRNPVFIKKMIKYVGYILLAVMTIEQLGLGQTIVSTIVLILLGAVAFGAALAIGLGCKDMARRYIEDMIRTMQEKERIKRGTDLEG
jgi:hypothetical protein